MITIDAIPVTRSSPSRSWVGEVEYRAWTDNGKLRHASLKGDRPREDEAAVFDLN
ncbi:MULTISPECIES: hypothetical protein [Sinorhizobium]|uniref:hypothetical protein n=1 Tax=Sinorhizobium TaxID=28105 RepID=UPI0035F2DB87